MDSREQLSQEIGDPAIIRYYYLDRTTKELAIFLNNLHLTLLSAQDEVPFNAQVKSYLAARDEENHLWLIKPVLSKEEMLFHRSCELAYLLDHRTGTLAAPTTALYIEGKPYRATKAVQKFMQISSYDYLEEPFISILRLDLINRWIYFDEDRNPNNYLVITNAKNRPFIVAIDYDKADMLAEHMKITGTPEKFGWIRTEKTRFLTLLRPDNFERLSIEDFSCRLSAFESITFEELRDLALIVFDGFCDNPAAQAESVARHLIERRDYVLSYFRTMFKPRCETPSCQDDEYAALGKSFLDMHKRKL